VKNNLFALLVLVAVAPSLFSACSSGDDQVGEELFGEAVEPDPVLGGGQGVATVPFAYRFTGSDLRIDLSGQLLLRANPTLYLSAEFSGMASYENAWALSPSFPSSQATVPFGNGSLAYQVTFVPTSPIADGYVRFECVVEDASGAVKAYAKARIAEFSRDQ
jgi:hypothetical protein